MPPPASSSTQNFLINMAICFVVATDLTALLLEASIPPLCFNAYLMYCVCGYTFGYFGISTVKRASYVGVLAMVLRIGGGLRFGLFIGKGTKLAGELISLTSAFCWVLAAVMIVMLHDQQPAYRGSPPTHTVDERVRVRDHTQDLGSKDGIYAEGS